MTICQQLTEYMSNRSEKLQKAARSYQTAAAFRIYMNAPRNGVFDSEIQTSEQFLKINCKLVAKTRTEEIGFMYSEKNENGFIHVYVC